MTLTPGRYVNRFRNGSTLVVDTLVLLWVGALSNDGRKFTSHHHCLWAGFVPFRLQATAHASGSSISSKYEPGRR